MISHADTSPSTEPRGVEVSFPVKVADVDQFTRAAVRVYKGFATQPLGLPAAVVTALEPPVQSSGEGWVMVAKSWLPAAKLWALQGCVLYPLELEQVEPDEKVREVFKYLEGAVVLDFPVGQLEFTPGRETLAYSPDTLSNLRAGWARFQRGISTSFDEQFVGCVTDWELAVRSAEVGLSKMFGGMFRLTEISKRIEAVEAAVSKALKYQSSRSRKRGWKTSDPVSKYPNHIAVLADGTATRTRGDQTSGLYPSGAVFGTTPVLWVERSTGVSTPWRRLSHYMTQRGIAMALVHEEEDSAAIDWSRYGYPPVVRLANMEAPPALPRAQTEWERYRCFEPSGSDYGYNQWVRPAEDDPRMHKAPVVFVCDGMVVRPHPTAPAKDWERLHNMADLNNMALLELAAGRRAPVQVRMRAGEVYRRFASLQLFAHDPLELVANLTPGEIAWAVNLINMGRFRNSHYYEELRKLQHLIQREQAQHRGPLIGSARRTIRPVPCGATNPLLELERFQNRADAVPAKRGLKLQRLINRLGPPALDYLLRRGLEQDLEVLPEPGVHGELPYPLLPLAWENAARMVGGDTRYPYSISRVLALVEQENGK